MYIADLVNIIFGLFYILLGMAVYRYPDLITGYNTMEQEKKQKFDIMAFKSKMKKGFVLTGVLSVAVGVLLAPFDCDTAKTVFATCSPIVLCVFLMFIAAKCHNKE